MTKVNPNNGNETNKKKFHATYSNLPQNTKVLQ